MIPTELQFYTLCTAQPPYHTSSIFYLQNLQETGFVSVYRIIPDTSTYDRFDLAGTAEWGMKQKKNQWPNANVCVTMARQQLPCHTISIQTF